MSVIKKTEENAVQYAGVGEGRDREGILSRCLWESMLGQPLWKSVWRFLKKLKIELHYSSILLFCIMQE
jgi:hypothetical protein